MTSLVFLVSMLCTAVQPGDMLAPAVVRCQIEKASASGSERAGLIRHLLPAVKKVRLSASVDAWSSSQLAQGIDGPQRLVSSFQLASSPALQLSTSRPIRAPSVA
jgi:hypothetical protein